MRLRLRKRVGQVNRHKGGRRGARGWGSQEGLAVMSRAVGPLRVVKLGLTGWRCWLLNTGWMVWIASLEGSELSVNQNQRCGTERNPHLSLSLSLARRRRDPQVRLVTHPSTDVRVRGPSPSSLYRPRVRAQPGVRCLLARGCDPHRPAQCGPWTPGEGRLGAERPGATGPG